ncbi:hypothetical protein Q1695_011316 [Nippostrongylus brasiliensis]|nr:hypothetical protein Q1695_011316 [Nippostrongylus brasiliensis]
MAFGGLLDGFLAEKNFEGSSRGRRGLHTMNPRRSLTIGMENDKMAVKKISTVSAPMHKYSWPLARDACNSSRDMLAVVIVLVVLLFSFRLVVGSSAMKC